MSGESIRVQLMMPEPSHHDFGSARLIWNTDMTLLLISIYNKWKGPNGKATSLPLPKVAMKISEEMRSAGYEVDPEKVESKWKSLERAYKNVLKNNNQTGAQRKTCPFER